MYRLRAFGGLVLERDGVRRNLERHAMEVEVDGEPDEPVDV
jgi:hypothetical protein